MAGIEFSINEQRQLPPEYSIVIQQVHRNWEEGEWLRVMPTKYASLSKITRLRVKERSPLNAVRADFRSVDEVHSILSSGKIYGGSMILRLKQYRLPVRRSTNVCLAYDTTTPRRAVQSRACVLGEHRGTPSKTDVRTAQDVPTAVETIIQGTRRARLSKRKGSSCLLAMTSVLATVSSCRRMLWHIPSSLFFSLPFSLWFESSEECYLQYHSFSLLFSSIYVHVLFWRGTPFSFVPFWFSHTSISAASLSLCRQGPDLSHS